MCEIKATLSLGYIRGRNATQTCYHIRVGFDIFDSYNGGKKGGQSTSAAKRAAARRNGRKGGRPVGNKKRTLGEYLMRRRLTPAQLEQIGEGFLQLGNKEGRSSQQETFKRIFGIDKWVGLGFKYDFLKTTDYVQPKRLTERQQFVIAKFRLVARHYLRG